MSECAHIQYIDKQRIALSFVNVCNQCLVAVLFMFIFISAMRLSTRFCCTNKYLLILCLQILWANDVVMNAKTPKSQRIKIKYSWKWSTQMFLFFVLLCHSIYQWTKYLLNIEKLTFSAVLEVHRFFNLMRCYEVMAFWLFFIDILSNFYQISKTIWQAFILTCMYIRIISIKDLRHDELCFYSK